MGTCFYMFEQKKKHFPNFIYKIHRKFVYSYRLFKKCLDENYGINLNVENWYVYLQF